MYNPTLQDYNIYYLRDASNMNASIDYSYQLPGFIIAGETALSKRIGRRAAYPTVSPLFQSLLRAPSPILSNILQCLYAQAFSEGSAVRNEKGLFINMQFIPFSRLTLNSYLDLVRYPWLKYGGHTRKHWITICWLLFSLATHLSIYDTSTNKREIEVAR